jgi:hypothetical protein
MMNSLVILELGIERFLSPLIPRETFLAFSESRRVLISMSINVLELSRRTVLEKIDMSFSPKYCVVCSNLLCKGHTYVVDMCKTNYKLNLEGIRLPYIL